MMDTRGKIDPARKAAIRKEATQTMLAAMITALGPATVAEQVECQLMNRGRIPMSKAAKLRSSLQAQLDAIQAVQAPTTPATDPSVDELVAKSGDFRVASERALEMERAEGGDITAAEMIMAHSRLVSPAVIGSHAWANYALAFIHKSRRAAHALD